MALDPNIALQAKPAQFDNPLTQYAQVAAIQNAQNQNQLAQYTIGKAQRDDADELEVRNALAGAGGDLEKGKNALYSKGLYKQAGAIGKTQLEQDKTKSEIGKNNATAGATEYETKMKKWKTAINDIVAFDTPEAAITSLQSHVQAGDVPADRAQAILQTMPQTGDRAAFRKWQLGMIQGIMDAKDRMEYIAPNANTVANNQTSLATTGMNNQTALATNASTVGATIRGQNMTAATAAAGQAAGKVPSGYRANPDGSLSFIPGGPADPSVKDAGPASEDERKAAGWLTQADNAWKNMQSVMVAPDGKSLNKDAVKPGKFENSAASFGMEQTANWLRSADRQKFVQGSSSLSEALLRAATGAGMNVYEAKQKVEEITPTLNDSDEVMQQKLSSIPVYLESLKARAGRAAPKNIDLTTVKPGTGDFNAVMADAKRIGELRKQSKTASPSNGAKFLGFE